MLTYIVAELQRVAEEAREQDLTSDPSLALDPFDAWAEELIRVKAEQEVQDDVHA